MNNIHLVINGQQSRPYSIGQIRELLRTGKATPQTLAWHEGLSGWTALGTVMASSLGAGTPPAAPFVSVAPGSSPAPVAKKERSGCGLTAIILACVAAAAIPVLACLAGVALGPITQGIKMAKESASMQTSRTIALAMFSYAQDNKGAYPTGKTSTEVFQKLLDGNYISDPSVFYIDMPGKVRGRSKTLKPENVCYDVTGGVTDKSPDGLPLVFCTGYTVTYTAGSSAVRDPSTRAPFASSPPGHSDGMSVGYKSNNAKFVNADAVGAIPNFVAVDFNAGTVIYTQLKP